MVIGFYLLGADIVAPSDMNDGRVGAIDKVLEEKNLRGKVLTHLFIQYIPPVSQTRWNLSIELVTTATTKSSLMRNIP